MNAGLVKRKKVFVGTIDLKPTPKQYAKMLLLIIKKQPQPEITAEAEEEIIAAFEVAAQFNPDAWGKE